MLYGMPVPRPDIDTAAFWDGLHRREFLVPACGPCGHRRWPPGPCCPRCQSFEVEWVVASGNGTLYSWTVVHHPVSAVLRDQVPYVIALVDLDEGIRVLGNLVGLDGTDPAAGQPVRMVFETAADGRVLPNFRPA